MCGKTLHILPRPHGMNYKQAVIPHLVADNLSEAHLSGGLNDLLKLPTCYITDTNIANLGKTIKFASGFPTCTDIPSQRERGHSVFEVSPLLECHHPSSVSRR